MSALFASRKSNRDSGRRALPGRVCGTTLFVFGALAAVFSLMAGCGSGSNRTVTTGSGTLTPIGGQGKAQFSVNWPSRSAAGRLIPVDSNSIQLLVTSTDGKRLFGSALLVRPAGGGSASATVDTVPIGPALVTATAYPNADGTGQAQASAAIPVTVAASVPTPVSLTMVSTITKVDVAPATGSLYVGGTETLVATPRDAAGNVVLISPSTLSWSSSNGAVATVAATGVVSGVAAGSATITATETESRIAGNSTVAVSNAPTPTPTPTTVPTPAPAATISFAASVSYACPSTRSVVRYGDFDRDGNQDVVAGSKDVILVYYGNGDGTLGAPVTVFTSSEGANVETVADLNNDGLPDIICGSDGDDAFMLLNTGRRTFKPFTVPIGHKTHGAITGDFNGDGYADVALCYAPNNQYSGSVTIVINHAGTSFGVGNSIGFNAIPYGVDAADLNRDGKQDIVVCLTNYVLGGAGVDVFLGNGDGSFNAGTFYGTGTNSVPEPHIDDFNRDGKLDIGESDYSDSNMAILLGNGDGTFQSVSRYADPNNPSGWKIADMDGDGYPDLVTPNDLSRNVSVFRNLGDGTLAPYLRYTTQNPSNHGCCLPDLNNDGRPDIVVIGDDLLCVLINTSK